ncbi:MAG: hypothetical protein ABIG87_02470, partial [Patescibacteria group bacterium]
MGIKGNFKPIYFVCRKWGKMGSATIFINNNKLWKNNCFVSRKKYNLIMAKGRNQRKNIKKPKK